MKTVFPDLELELELQELYILSRHWMQDVSYIEDEVRFFKTIFVKHFDPEIANELNSIAWGFNQKIVQLEENVNSLKFRIQDYLKFLAPFINNQDKVIYLNLIEKFNTLGAEIRNLFLLEKQTKTELFACAEMFMVSKQSGQR
jgi:hypothetical protein